MIRQTIAPGRRRALLAALLAAASLLTASDARAAGPAPAWSITAIAAPGSFAPGDGSGHDQFEIIVTNSGHAPTDGSPITITDGLPAGLSLDPAGPSANYNEISFSPLSCSAGPPISCSGAQPLAAGGAIVLHVPVDVAPGPVSGLANSVTVSGGGAPTVSATNLAAISPAPPAFGFPPGASGFDLSPSGSDGLPVAQAGSHPFQLTTTVNFNRALDSRGVQLPAADARDVHTALPPGLLGNPTVLTRCTYAEFTTPSGNHKKQYGLSTESCPDSSQIGSVAIELNPSGNGQTGFLNFGVYNLTPPPGVPAMLGFNPLGLAIRLTPHLRNGDYGLTLDSLNTSQLFRIYGVRVTIWGTPWDPGHDGERGECLSAFGGSTGQSCPVNGTPRAYLTLPASCTGPTASSITADSWQSPAAYLPGGEPDPSDPGWASAAATSHDNQGNPLGLDGCNQIPFSPQVSAAPTTDSATSPTGFDFNLDVDDPGLTNPEGTAQSQIKKAVVTLPQGFTTNPSVAEGLHVCTEAQYEAEELHTEAGQGCPESSKVGDVEIESPLVEQKIDGSLFVAKQGENPFHSLLALYLVARNPQIGVFVKSAGRVEPDPLTGQLTTTFDNLPQLPISHFHLHFRQGQRSPLISPPACGTYAVAADLYPWARPGEPVHRTSSFQITQGPEGLPCPSGGVPPFHPRLEAGTQNNAAGTYSPFYTHITRKDSEQEITHFSIKLPPGVAAKLAGVPFCPAAGIAQAKAREHEGGGTEEEQNPSCPAASEVGHTLVGSGVGNVLAYAPGKFYLAGPYHGSKLSFVSITAAKVGPFDLGTVVVRFALRVDPETAEVFVDSVGSDPIPHIVDGIPVHLRDIRGYIDRPEFTFNPTSCEPTFTASTVLGSGLDFVSEADDQPITVSSPFQAADCAALAFKPKLALSLKGSTKRGGNPAFKAVLTYPYQPTANIASAQVTLPNSEFLDNAHIGTVCTRVEFKQGITPGEKCPPDSVYGSAKALSPVFSEPLEGPVYLRSTGTGPEARQLPDLVAALHNQQVDIALVGFTEGTRGGGIRNTFKAVPDAPVTSFTLELKGAHKGLLENSKNLCAHPNRADAVFTGHNGKVDAYNPLLTVDCAKKHRHKHHKRGGRR